MSENSTDGTTQGKNIKKVMTSGEIIISKGDVIKESVKIAATSNPEPATPRPTKIKTEPEK